MSARKLHTGLTVPTHSNRSASTPSASQHNGTPSRPRTALTTDAIDDDAYAYTPSRRSAGRRTTASAAIHDASDDDGDGASTPHLVVGFRQPKSLAKFMQEHGDGVGLVDASKASTPTRKSKHEKDVDKSPNVSDKENPSTPSAKRGRNREEEPSEKQEEEESCRITRSKRSINSNPSTPTSKPAPKTTSTPKQTPSTLLKRKQKEETPMTTRYQTRHRMQSKLKSVLNDRGDRSSSDDDEDDALSTTSSSTDQDKENDETNDGDHDDAAKDTMMDTTTDFFAAHGNRTTKNKSGSQNRVLDPLDSRTYHTIMSTMQPKHTNQKQLLHQTHVNYQYTQWRYELECGFNLMLYGYGSKIQLVNKFIEDAVMSGDDEGNGYPVVIVNGFFPGIGLKDIVMQIEDQVVSLYRSEKDCAGQSMPRGSLSDQIRRVLSALHGDERIVPCMYLVIHCIDGPGLRNPHTQSVLSMISGCDGVRLVCTMDMIHAPMMWDMETTYRYGWIWHDATTMVPYDVEIGYENSVLMMMVMGSGGGIGGARLGVVGMVHVLRSLTMNARKIFRILVEHQIEAANQSGVHDDLQEADDAAEWDVSDGEERPQKKKQKTKRSKPASSERIVLGLPINTLYHDAVDKFLVTNELTFRMYLREFRDHKMIAGRRCADGSEEVFVPLKKDELKMLIEEYDW